LIGRVGQSFVGQSFVGEAFVGEAFVGEAFVGDGCAAAAATIPAYNTNVMRSIRMLLCFLQPLHGFPSYLWGLMVMQRVTRCDIDRTPDACRGPHGCDEVLAVDA
jgi:hypothetical protein